MKKIFSLLLISLIVHTVWAQSGEGYNPQNPGDPDVYYTLEVDASPKSGGSVSPSSRQKLSPGKEVYCYANAKTGYKFKNWMIGDSLISSNSSMYFTMPEHDVVLTAHFDWIGNDDYNPQNPGDPFADGYQHKVTLYATPSVGGYFNSSSFYLREGESTNVYAYSRDGYRFVSWKQNGTIVSTSNPMQIRMGTNNQEYTAQFVYDPENPGNPSPNSFNSATGELVIDEFTTGDLNRAISSAIGGSENYHLVQSIKIIGRMSSSDFGFSYRLSNCSLIDLARTTGYTEIPRWSFEDLSALTKIVLPSSVERICYNAFYNCGSLSEIVCYATVPPVLESGAFNNVPSGLIVRVPSSSLSLYTKAEGWKNLTIMPLDEESCTINVSLPSDAGDGRYKNMTLELDNISSGQILKYLITERTSYTFANLVRDTKYNIFVKNASGSILGSIQDVEVSDKDVNVSFIKLLQPRNVVLNVLANHETVTDQVTVSWTDFDGKYLGQGNILSGILEGSKIVYQISLPQSLGSEYVVPASAEYTVKNGTNNVICTLQPFEKLTVNGHVEDLTTGSAIQNATITFSQRLNGKYSKSQTIKTNRDGFFITTISEAPFSATIAANNYLSQTVEIADVSNLRALNVVRLKGITGAVITTNFTYQESVAEGVEPKVVESYSDYSNVSYTIFNTTTGKEIKSFKIQYPSIVLLEEVSEGDWLKIVASSKNNSFVDVVAEGLVDSYNRIIVTIPVVQLGGLNVNASTTNNKSNIGILYSSNGQLVRKTNYDGTTLNMSGILDGEYTLVSMGNSKFYNSVLNISELSNSGLTEGKDYVKNNVTVKSGRITSIEISDIPEFDESQFYYTGSNTLVSVNKSSVTIGNYITLRGKVDFKSEYADAVSNVKLVFDLPENCSFVDNSVLAGNGACSYSVESGRITVDLPTINDQIRFCVVPRIGGTYRPNAFVRFNLGGETILQPIGSVYFSAENMKINVPSKTAFSSVVVKGVATSDSEVKVYDNGVLVGQTYSIANGQWSTKVDLYKPYSKSYHSLYAEIKNANGEVFLTDTKSLEYDKNYTVPFTITMINFAHEEQKTIFDLITGVNSRTNYAYNPSMPDFTFVADFTKNDPELIQNLVFVVKASDGTKRKIPANFNSSKNIWVAKAQYANSGKLPVNVTVDYDSTGFTSLFDEAQEADNNDILDDLINQMLSAYNNGEATLIINNQDELCFSITPKETNKPEYFRIVKNNYNDIINNYRNSDFVKISNGSVDGGAVQFFEDQKYNFVFWNNTTQEAFSLTYTGVSSMNSGGQNRIVPFLISAVAGIGFAVGEYYLGLPEIEGWYQTIENEIAFWNNHGPQILDFLYATCDDGKYKIKDDAKIVEYRESIDEWWRSVQQYINDFRAMVDSERQQHKNKCTLKGALNVGLSAIGGIASGITGLFSKSGTVAITFSKETVELCSESLVPEMVTGVTEEVSQAVGYVHGNYLDNVPVRQNISNWYVSNSRRLMDFYCNTIKSIKNDYSSCEKDDEDDEPEDEDDEPEFTTDDIKPSIDPSGFVYEGVSSNRLEGVTATAYYKEQVEDMYGDLHDNIVKWDAEEYAQENPLFTDENGMYAWDVPQGMWQVKFEKEGYETTYSEWLPVPPPQLDVNVAMTQVRQPEVKAVHAYKNGVEIEFDKYMLPETLTPDNIYVTANGESVEGEVVMLNEEVSYEGESTVYASKVRFNPAKAFTASELTLTVANKVKSYAGIQMQDSYTQSFDIELEIAEINVASELMVPYGEKVSVTINVTPTEAAVGKTLVVKSASDLIASVEESSIIIDEQGTATITINGELPGTTVLTFSIDGYDITATSIVSVDINSMGITETPTASIPSGSTVAKGTSITLSCATEGTTIYYTLDGSCPCDEATRLTYTEPIVINKTVTIKAMAVTPDMTESDIAEFTYIVDEEDGIDEVTLDTELKIYPLPVRDKLNVTAGGKTIKSVALTSINGSTVVKATKPVTMVTLDVSSLTPGIYIINVATEDKTYSRKIMKVEK